jgi:FixJ family two-component response regulator
MRSGKGLIVGVVDDDKRVLRSLKGLLEAVGHRPLLFNSAEKFLDCNAVQAVDCLISDIGMPAMNGIELRSRVLEARPQLPVFLLTGREEWLSKAETEQHRERLLLKPLNGLQLVAALEKL